MLVLAADGVLAAIGAGHDDSADTGDFHVHDDGDEQQEPLGSRTALKWTSVRRTRGGGAATKGGVRRSARRKVVRKSPAPSPSPPAGAPPALVLPTLPPEPADVGRRLMVFWADEKRWFPGVLAAIEAGHDDGADAGDFYVVYDDGDEQWEPLGSRTAFKLATSTVVTRTAETKTAAAQARPETGLHTLPAAPDGRATSGPGRALEAAQAEELTLVTSLRNATGYRGVTYNPRCKARPYELSVTQNSKSVYVGSYATAEEAALDYARRLGPEKSAAEAAPLMTADEALAAAEAEGLTLRMSAKSATRYEAVRHKPNAKTRPYEVQLQGAQQGSKRGLGMYATPEEAALVYARWLHAEPERWRRVAQRRMPVDTAGMARGCAACSGQHHAHTCGGKGSAATSSLSTLAGPLHGPTHPPSTHLPLGLTQPPSLHPMPPPMHPTQPPVNAPAARAQSATAQSSSEQTAQHGAQHTAQRAAKRTAKHTVKHTAKRAAQRTAKHTSRRQGQTEMRKIRQ